MSHKDISQECLARVSSTRVLKRGSIRVRGFYQLFYERELLFQIQKPFFSCSSMNLSHVESSVKLAMGGDPMPSLARKNNLMVYVYNLTVLKNILIRSN